MFIKCGKHEINLDDIITVGPLVKHYAFSEFGFGPKYLVLVCQPVGSQRKLPRTFEFYEESNDAIKRKDLIEMLGKHKQDKK